MSQCKPRVIRRGQLGHGHPTQVRAAIENSADGFRKSGADPYYGKGRINVARALGIR